MKNSEQNTQITLVENSLQQSFNGITAKRLAADFAEVEQKRADWLVLAVMFGIKCIAAKPQVKHGDFRAFLAKAIKDGKSLATARRYMGLACQVVAQVARPDEANEIGARVIEYFKITGSDNPRLFFASPAEAADTLKYLLQGYSLSGLTKALKNVDAQVSVEEKVANAGDREIPEEKKAAVQLSFEEELFAPIGEIQKLITSDSFAGLPKEKALQFADALIAEGQALKRKLTK